MEASTHIMKMAAAVRERLLPLWPPRLPMMASISSRRWYGARCCRPNWSFKAEFTSQFLCSQRFDELPVISK